MLPLTNKGGTLTPWGAQQQIGLHVLTPSGVGRLLAPKFETDCTEIEGVMWLVSFEPYGTKKRFALKNLKPYPVPLTAKTVYVGQYVRLIEQPHKIGVVFQVNELVDGADIEAEFQQGYLRMRVEKLEALPAHCQTVKP